MEEQKWELRDEINVFNNKADFFLHFNSEAKELANLLNSYESKISELKKERDYWKVKYFTRFIDEQLTDYD